MKYRSILQIAGLSIPMAFLGVANAQPPGGGPPPPPEVGVITVEAQTLPVAFEYIGVSEASKMVEVRSRVRGFIERREFEEGAVVKAGESLFTIDARSFQADLDITAAQVDQAESRLKLAEQEVKRLQSVKEPGAIAQSDLDQRVAEQTNAAAALRLARAEQAKAELELSYTTVESPLNGFVGRALKEIGSFVDEGQNSLLAMVWQVDPIYVTFQVQEREFLTWRNEIAAGRMALQDASEPYVEATLLDGTKLPERGLINFESAVVDPKTGSVEMRAEFANPQAVLKPGQFIKASLGGWARVNAVAVPQRAVSQSPQGAFLYVVDAENKAVLRMVELGDWSGDLWIVRSGLEPGEKVIVDGLVKVQPGIVVVPGAPGGEQAKKEAAAAEAGDAPTANSAE